MLAITAVTFSGVEWNFIMSLLLYYFFGSHLPTSFFHSSSRLYECILPDSLQSARQIYQRSQGAFPKEQLILWSSLFSCCAEQEEGYSNQEASQETRSDRTYSALARYRLKVSVQDFSQGHHSRLQKSLCMC